MYTNLSTQEEEYTWNSQNDCDFDPDVHLSYIEDRVRSVLGHFQKDFEGDVGKDKLGAKYGGYGSFLPVCERSPPDVPHSQNKNIQIYPNDTSMKKFQQDTNLRSHTMLTQNDTNGTLLSVSKALALSTSLKEDVCLSSTQGSTCVSTNRPLSPIEQKPDNDPKKKDVHMLAQRNFEMYRELGLDSPSSSEEKSPQSGRLTFNTQEARSPMCMLVDTRTISPLEEYSLASPSNNLLCKDLIPDESVMSILENMTSFPVPGGCLLSPLPEGFLHLMDNQGEVKCESMGFSNASNAEKKSKDTLKIKIRGCKKLSPHRDVQLDCIRTEERKGLLDCIRTEERKGLSSNSQLEGSEGMKDLDCRPENSIKGICRRDRDHEQCQLMSSPRKEKPRSGEKKELKRNQCRANNVERNGFGYSATTAKHTSNDYPSRRKIIGDRLFKDSDKTKRIHEDSDSTLEQSEKRSALLGSLLRDGPQGSKPSLCGKENQTFTKKEREKSGGKMFEDSLRSEVDLCGAPVLVPLNETGPVSDALPEIVNSTEVDEWVSCDSCGKWRLLPFGTNADHLEEAVWHCRMMHWMPGMNYCDISEEETTKALRALCQFLPSDCHPDAPDQCRQSLASLPTAAKKREHSFDDTKHSKLNAKSLVASDGSEHSRKRKSESFYPTNEKICVAKVRVAGKMSPGLSKGILLEKHAQKRQKYPCLNDSKSNQKVRLSDMKEKPRDRAEVSLTGTGRDMGCSGTRNDVVEKISTEGQRSSTCSFQDDSLEILEGGKGVGTIRKKRPGLINGFSTERNVQICSEHSSCSELKYNQKSITPALVKKPRDLVTDSFSGGVIETGNSDNVNIVADKRRTLSHLNHVPSYQDNREEANVSEDEIREKLGSGLSNDSYIGKARPEPRSHSSSNESNFDPDRVTASAKKMTKIRISLRGRSKDVAKSYKITAVREKQEVDVNQRSVCSLQDSKEETSEVLEKGEVTRKLVSHSSDGFSNGKDGRKHKLYPSSNDSTCDKKDGVSALAKIPRHQVNVSLDGKSKEIKDSDKMHIVREKRRPGGCPNDDHSFQDKEEETNKSGVSEEKKAGVSHSVCKEDVRRKGNGVAVSPPVTLPKVIRPNVLPADIPSCVSKVPKQLREFDRENGFRDCSVSRCTQKRSITKDPNTQGSVKNSFSNFSVAKTVIKEGNELQNKADCLKDFGSKLESTSLFFQAALKYLRGAFLLGLCDDANSECKHGGHSLFLYRRTAEICESVALAYERCNEMAAAAMAYKCMEVAYTRITNFRASSIKEDFHDLHMGVLAETPSPSISDVFNPNTLGKLGKVAQADGNDSQLYKEETIVNGNVPKYGRVLNNAGDMFNVMQAIMNHQRALAVAKAHKGDSKSISLVELATSSGFLDIEKLIRRVQVALDAIFD